MNGRAPGNPWLASWSSSSSPTTFSSQFNGQRTKRTNSGWNTTRGQYNGDRPRGSSDKQTTDPWIVAGEFRPLAASLDTGSPSLDPIDLRRRYRQEDTQQWLPWDVRSFLIDRRC
ncbi:uncharacterized protein LOC143425714 [Xylocopa sonorina]|uniref:uncharacterized protein LOC143425714 n=1 Tax=Xylocopa sonorina TaxID=1818115 RepID=UPI00403AE1AF